MTEVDAEARSLIPEPQPQASEASRKRIMTYSVMAGLCPLIPVPFVDDIVLGTVRKRFIRGLFRDAGRSISDDQLDVLCREESGCVLGCLAAVVVYPIKKIFRKVFFFLSIKDCVDVASKMFHTGYLLQKAVESEHLSASALGDVTGAGMEPVKRAIDATLGEIDARPINQVINHLFAGGRRWMRKAAGALWQGVREERRSGEGVSSEGAPQAQSAEIDTVVEELGRAVWVQTGYLEALESHFVGRLRGEEAGEG